MKKSVLSVVMTLFILVCLTSLATYSQYQPSPPELEMVIEKHAMEVKPVTYSLKKWGRTAAADTNADPALLVRESPSMAIETDGKIKLNFEQSPDSVKCYLWEMETGRLAYKGLKGSPLSLGKTNVSSGEYAMEIRAKWNNGYVLYIARIHVYDNQNE